MSQDCEFEYATAVQVFPVKFVIILIKVNLIITQTLCRYFSFFTESKSILLSLVTGLAYPLLIRTLLASK